MGDVVTGQPEPGARFEHTSPSPPSTGHVGSKGVVAARAGGALEQPLSITELEQRTRELQSLQEYSVRRILLVASLYDSYALSEDQHLAELLIGAYHSLSLADPPRIDRVTTHDEALAALDAAPYDLVLVMANAGPMSLTAFGRAAKERAPGTSVIAVAYEAAELNVEGATPEGVDRAYLWRGDVRLLVTIIKVEEDARNAARDARIAGVRTLILIEDGIPFASAYLPLLFEEVTRQTDRLISDSVNTGQRLLRRRLRPRILHAITYEEGWALYREFRSTLLCVVSDLRFPHDGEMDSEAGIRLLEAIRREDPEVPLLLQSSHTRASAAAALLGAGFINKQSPTLLHDIRSFMLENLGFGDFVFRAPDGTEVARAADVHEMLQALRTVPAESVRHHALLNHFSNWLMARTEFTLATALRKLRVSDFDSVESMRSFLVQIFANVIEATRRGQVEDFAARRFEASAAFVRIGGGSLGGKGRGLAFVHELLSRSRLDDQDGAVIFQVPRSAVLGTDVFDEFIEANDLVEYALREEHDEAILAAFQSAPLPEAARADLEAYLREVDFPIAVRSSSLLEDSRHLPAAGIYPTHLLPNEGTVDERLAVLAMALRHVYASTFFNTAKRYLEGSPGRVEDEKMAVVLQEIVGRRHERFLYPDVSGVARSRNVYPMGDMRSEDGIVIAALGLGRTVVDGERAVRFSPAAPAKSPHLGPAEQVLRLAQREFWAMDLSQLPDLASPAAAGNQVRLGLDVARRHGTLAPVASVYSPQNDALYDGLSREGVPLVTMAPLLKRHGRFDLSAAITSLLELGEAGLGGSVEIEFAATLEPTGSGPAAVLHVLQIRPLVMSSGEDSNLSAIPFGEILVGPCRALGAGRIGGLHDLVVVRPDAFERGQTPSIAMEVGRVNATLRELDRPFVLIGPGRWGTADRWLGVPVAWEQISHARVIVETSLDGREVAPSEGAHFFHNVTSLGIGYFTAHMHTGGRTGKDAVDWAWLDKLSVAYESAYVRHYHVTEDIEALIDGRTGQGVIRKAPAEEAGS